jgi:hypothetical protein
MLYENFRVDFDCLFSVVFDVVINNNLHKPHGNVRSASIEVLSGFYQIYVRVDRRITTQ